MNESDVLAAIDELERDEIDDLVDAQLRQERSGYDHHINQPECIHCRGDAHSVPITKRMQEMRRLFQRTVQYYEDGPRASDELIAQLDAYRYDQDDSEIVCPGSEFIGPPRPSRWQLEQNRQAAEQERRAAARERQIIEYLAGDPSYERLRACVESGTYFGSEYALGCFYAGLPLPDAEEDISEWTVSHPFGPFARPDWHAQMRGLRESFAGVAEGLRQAGQEIGDALLPFVTAFQIRPRPSITEWERRLYALHAELQIHLYRNPTAVLMPDERPGRSRRLGAVLGIPVRYIPASEGYVGYLHESSTSGMGAAMCDYLALERATTEPVIVASREAVQLTVGSERLFFEPIRVDFRDTAATAPAIPPRRSSELRNMRVHELPSLDYIFVGYRMQVPSADDIDREVGVAEFERLGFSPSRSPGSLERAERWAAQHRAEPYRPEGVRGTSEPILDEVSWTEPPAGNRRQRRGHQEPAEPMWTRRPGLGRSRRIR